MLNSVGMFDNPFKRKPKDIKFGKKIQYKDARE